MKVQLTVVSALLFGSSLLTSAAPIQAEETPKSHDDMRIFYHDLDMANQKAKKEYKVSIDLVDMEAAYDLCIGKSAELENCRKKTSELQDKLHSRVHDAQMLAEQKKQTELLRQQAIAAKTPATTNVTIIENTQDEYYYKKRRRHHEGWREEREEHLPGPTPPSVRLDFHQKFR